MEATKFRFYRDERAAVGRNIRAVMKEKGITQVQIAEALGISQPPVSAYARGVTSPSPQRLVAIANILGVPPERLAPTYRAPLAGDEYCLYIKGDQQVAFNLRVVARNKDDIRKVAEFAAEMGVVMVPFDEA